MAGTVVEVGKMSGSSETTNGSKRGGFASTNDGVGVSGTPQMDGDGERQADIEKIKTRRMTAIGRCIGSLNYIRDDKSCMS
jgi:hypothetical protein